MVKRILNINSLYDFVVKKSPTLKGLKFRQSFKDVGGDYGNREIIDADTSENDSIVIGSILERYKNKLKQEFGVSVNVVDGEKYKQINVGKFEVRFHYIESDSKINWGNINENIMTLCIGCRFLFKNRDVRSSDYYKILEFHFKDKKNIVNLKSANKKTTIKDDLEITLSDLYRKQLYTERNTEKYKKILKSNIDYVNNSKIKSWSVYLYNNGVKDYIKVRSVGKLGKKSDINVFIKNKKGDFKDINLDISAKLDINQFGQYAGTDYEKLNIFLKDIFGNGTKEIEGKYNKIITGENNPQKSQKDRSKQALSLIYGHIFGKAKKNIKIQTLFDGIIKYMSGGRKNFQIVETKFEGVNIFDVKKINDILSKLNEMELKEFDGKIKLEYSTYGKEKLPKIQVYFEDKILITVRVKYETSGDKFRNYIEKGPKLEELFKMQKEEDTLNVSTIWEKTKGSSYKIVRT